MQSIEFSTLEDDEPVPNPDVSNEESGTNEDSQMNGAAKNRKQDSLEQLLLARNKKLSNEMAVLRVSHQDLQERLDSLQEHLSRTNADLERAQNLNVTLESDLEKCNRRLRAPFLRQQCLVREHTHRVIRHHQRLTTRIHSRDEEELHRHHRSSLASTLRVVREALWNHFGQESR